MVGGLGGAISLFCKMSTQEAVEGAHDALDVRGGEEAPAEVRGVVVQSQVHRGHHRCLLEVEGRPDQGHDRTDGVAKVAAHSEGALVDEVEALDVLPALAALNVPLRFVNSILEASLWVRESWVGLELQKSFLFCNSTPHQ